MSTKTPLVSKDGVREMLEKLLLDKPWEVKTTTVKNLVEYILQEKKLKRENYGEARETVIEVLKEMNHYEKIKIIAGMGWAADDTIEFVVRCP